MKYLVTGAAGFIGFHLIKTLLEQGEIVVGLDNINDYYDVELKYARLKQTGILKEAISWNSLTQSTEFKSYRFIRINLEDKEALFDLFNNEGFDIVVNLAAQAGVRFSIENPDIYIQSNIIGFFNILEACRFYPVKHLFYASSSSVYGNSKKVPFREDDNVDLPISLYAATKKSNELMAYTYSHLFQISSTGLRFFTVYGPWGRPDMAVFKFTKAIINEQEFNVYNSGNLSRDFTYIDDIIVGMISLIKSLPNVGDKITHESDSIYKKSYNIINIGNNQPTNLMDFINLLEKILEKKALIHYQPMQQGDVLTTFANIDRISALTSFKPLTGLREGLESFVAWYKIFYNN